jgi:hypothetical protein
MPTESTFTNRHEKKNNCKICAFAVLLWYPSLSLSVHQLFKTESSVCKVYRIVTANTLSRSFSFNLFSIGLLSTGPCPRRPSEIRLLSFHWILSWESIHKIEPCCTCWPPFLNERGTGIEIVFTEFRWSSVFSSRNTKCFS